MQIISFFLFLMGFLFIFKFKININPQLLIKNTFVKATSVVKQSNRKETLKTFVNKLNGINKEKYLKKIQSEAILTLTKTGQAQQYKKTLRFSVLIGSLGFALSLVLLKNIFLAPILGIGLYFIPLWCVRFRQYSFTRYINEELELALSMTTTSYIRSNDIISAIEENVSNFGGAVKTEFQSFLKRVKTVNPSVKEELETLKASLDCPLFQSWCDLVILCQDDYTLKGALPPIIRKFSDLKRQQLENETNMMLPMKEAVTMIAIVLFCIPLLYFLNSEWFYFLMHSVFGQISVAISFLCILTTINKAIRLSGPIEFSL
ncbi:MAG: hypothetical protein RR087_00675 [Oscillospiraceae bacterium]